VGLDEAGVDGGGLFREFMNELLKSSFNPIRGLFKLTSDDYLYPNPNIAFIDENFGPHYYFLGRILGKVRDERYMMGLKFEYFRLFMKNFLRNYHLQHFSYKKFFHDHPERLIYII
jgi:ubiquitin-protein ligase E3 C